jgi:hypothetical protein
VASWVKVSWPPVIRSTRWTGLGSTGVLRATMMLLLALHQFIFDLFGQIVLYPWTSQRK